MNKKIITYIVSLFLSIAIVFSIQIMQYYTEGTIAISENLRFDFITLIKIFCLSLINFIIIKNLITKLSNKDISGSKKIWSNKKVFIVSFITIFINGLIFY